MLTQRARARKLLTLAPAAALTLGLAACDGDLAEQAEGGHLSWATSDVGSAGHSALVNLAAMLNREWGDYRVDVLPTAGAVQTVIGYSTGEYDGYYGADIAFYEMAHEIDRFEGFADQAERTPVQSFWAFPLETGLAIHERDAEDITSWGDLTGQSVFTGPPPWDVRANLERAMGELGVEHSYVEVDTDVAGSTLEGGDIAAIIAYTAGEVDPPPWLTEAELQPDMRILNPSDEEVSELEAAGFEVVEVDAEAFESDVGVDTALFVPFFYGFHLGLEVDADDVYDLLSVIEAHLDELAEADASFEMLAEDMADMQRRGVESAIDDVEVHPGLARWMQENDVWDEAWDDRIAEQ
jgi:TRAP-type uncharacterized transport system substrate-binding protein